MASWCVDEAAYLLEPAKKWTDPTLFAVRVFGQPGSRPNLDRLSRDSTRMGDLVTWGSERWPQHQPARNPESLATLDMGLVKWLGPRWSRQRDRHRAELKGITPEA
ncbi:hypothetical protein FGSG_12065 [Fusarium graminearum PH-1]|uniref:Chromosome 1, complete genome n=1 Tax=Gibberella zeae (strain ATCC MYA-4620 / CBS 123657 / FGSC 9075 / NRRL 31084 / PH-1) TaxID=229533 RepID=I1S5E7_GIBZE|nr:hypothetical protein FGSG_12065 [Fusarium graminearum PH-1]ESU07458.1 hypothetical protein FGSG_12065 [Fusarium graminearum PH-1]CEF74301.1 unnamed protein product [Fusarium graminearum]|eukprot:XP_011317943.1 hypothetical protein FGSG_12065 [Fusarium graminearum PH-1]